MVAEVMSGMVLGIQGELIKVQTDISSGLPLFNMIGHLSSETREARERVRTALKNTGFHLPPSRISVNLAPADLRKTGTCFDLSIAVGLFLAMNLIPPPAAEGIIFLGELALDGSLSPLAGVLPILKSAAAAGYKTCAVPLKNREEAALLPDMTVLAFPDLKSVFSYLSNPQAGPKEGPVIPCRNAVPLTAGKPASSGPAEVPEKELPDLSEVRGQDMAKRALEIAVAGFHNLFLDGPPGAGKSMLASCVPGIMPEMTKEERIETTIVYSVKGLLTEGCTLQKERPFRSPSPTTTAAGMFGGGKDPKPGEISLAHHGVLFLDEFPEFKRDIMELFRTPLEKHAVTQVRNGRTVTFPADFMLIAAANPCPCGYYPDRNLCRCSDHQIEDYQYKLNGPLLDRLDLFVRCDRVSYPLLTGREKGSSSEEVRERIARVWERQRQRYEGTGIRFNGRMGQKEVERYCALDASGEAFMRRIYDRFQLTGRSYFRLLKVCRTIADLAGEENIKKEHLEEALLYRRMPPPIKKIRV